MYVCIYVYTSLLLSISIDMKFSCKAVQKKWSTGGIGSLSLFSLSSMALERQKGAKLRPSSPRGHQKAPRYSPKTQQIFL